MNNSIIVYQNNTLNLSVAITNNLNIDLSGYTAILKININTGNNIIITGTSITSGNTTSFSVSSVQNNLKPYIYEYEVYIQNGIDTYTIITDSYSVLSSLINQT